MIWCLTRKVLYLICYKILHTLWFGVLQERFCIWSVIRYYIRYDLVSYKTGCVSDLLLDITYVMIWCLTRKVLYLICYKILHTLWFDVLQERFCIWFVIRYYIRYDLMSYKKGFVFVIRYYIRYDLMSYKKGLKIQNWEWEAVHRRRTENIYNGRQKRTINNNGRKNTTQNTKRSSNTSPTKNRGRTQVLPGR